MKNVVKKMLCAVMVLSLVITVAPTIYAAEDLLLMDANFDSLAEGNITSLSSSDFTHTKYDYSNGTDATTGKDNEVTQFASGGTSGTGVTTAIADSGYGKVGKSFVYNMNGVEGATENKMDFKWVPKVKSSDAYGRENIKVTYEFSIRTPENTGNGFQQYDVYLPIDGYKSLVSLQAKTNGVKAIYVFDKTDGNTWRTACNWEPGHWYHFAVVFTPGTNKIDYYMNGKLVYNGIYSKNYDVAGGRFRLLHKVTSVISGAKYNDTLGLDDVKVYIGTPKFENYSTDVSSSAYSLFEKTIYVGSTGTDHDTFINNITVANNGSVEVYTDDTYSTVATNVNEGCKVVVTSANGKVLDYYDVGGVNVILKCDMEDSVGIAPNAFPKYEGKLVGSNNTGTGSIGSTDGFSNYATTNVEEAGVGKDGYAYVINAVNSTDKTVNPAIDFKFVPNIDSGKVVFEASIRAPQNYDESNIIFYIPYNSSFKKMFSLEHDGKIGINNSYIRQWIPGRWYNFAAEFTIGSANADFYLNGDKILDDVEVYTQLNSDGVIGAVGGRMRFEVAPFAGCSTVTALDDVKVYSGEYDADDVIIECNNGDYIVSEAGFLLATPGVVENRVQQFKSKFSGNIELYEDDTIETTAGYVEEGNVLTATNESGNIIKYYNLIPEGEIAMTINDAATNKFSSRETVTIKAMAVCENANVLAAAYDSTGALLGVDFVRADAKDNARVSFNTKDGSYVKLMLWDETTIKPLADAIIINK